MKTAVCLSFLLFLRYSLQAAPGIYRIDTVAGGNNVGDRGPASHAPLRDCQGVAVDRAGNIYVADPGDQRVRKISPAGTITTVAGNGTAGFSGDDGPADLAQLNLPYGVSADPSGNLYIADLGNSRIRRVSPTGVITSLAGVFKAPRNVLADALGNVYVSEFDGNRVRRINTDGTITVIAGTGTRGRSGDFGLAALATLNSPAGLALDPAGILYVADSGNSVIRKLSGGMITTVLGTGVPGSQTPSQLNLPTGVTLDAFGNLYIADSGNGRIRKLSPSGTVSTVAMPARDVAIDSTGGLLVANAERVTKLLVSGATATLAGDGSYFFRGDGGPATDARLNLPGAVAVNAAGLLTIADTGNSRVRTVSASGTISTGTSDKSLRAPTSLSFDSQSNLLIADPPSAFIWKLNSSAFSPAAGNGFQSFNGEGFSALNSSLSLPSGVVAIPGGGFFIADTANHRVRRVNTGGTMLTAAGNERGGWNGDGVALAASLNSPTALALDSAGALYIADTGNDRIRKLTPDGAIVTVAGGSDSGLLLNRPRGLAIDAGGTLWVSDTGNHRILTLSREGLLTIAAGTGGPGFSGDGADARAAQLQSPEGLAADAVGNIYVADSGNNRIRILIAPPPAITEAGSPGYTVVGAASLQSGPAAPCSLITVFGPNASLLPMFLDGKLATPIGSVLNQATVQVPCTAAVPSVRLELGTAWTYQLPVAIAAPALFALNAGSGLALALNADNTPNSETNPAPRGSAVSLYATGMGLADNPAGVVIGRIPAELLFVGDAPGLLGITQINIRLPAESAGIQPVLVLSANISSLTAVMIAISVN